MNFIIENDHLNIGIRSKGAELDTIFSKETSLEYLWSGDPVFWGKKSPVLFPIVGTLINDQFILDGKTYSLSRHGFAREKEFEVADKSVDAIRFRLTDTEETREQYPFSFQFDIVYTLSGDALNVTYEVTNRGNNALYFSVGGHPAFRVPLEPELNYTDYYLQFNERETAGRWPISASGLIENEPIPLLEHADRLPLSKELFLKDAVVLKGLKSGTLSLKSEKSSHGLTFDFEGFPYLGIWAAKYADFVCIEPWCGIADHANHNQQLTEKEGINQLPAGDTFSRTWTATFF